jgi:hypothetical protein
MDREELKIRIGLKLMSERCVQAGWAFGVPEDGRAEWLDLVSETVIGIIETAAKKEMTNMTPAIQVRWINPDVPLV